MRRAMFVWRVDYAVPCGVRSVVRGVYVTAGSAYEAVAGARKVPGGVLMSVWRLGRAKEPRKED